MADMKEKMDAYLMGVAYAQGQKVAKGENPGNFEDVKLGYLMGVAYLKGQEIRRREMALDSALEQGKWITIHPHGDDEGYRRLFIDEAGTILKGGAKALIGKKVNEIGETFRKMKETVKKTVTGGKEASEKKTATGGEATSKKIKQVVLVPHKTEEERKTEIKEKLGGQVQNRDRTTASSKEKML